MKFERNHEFARLQSSAGWDDSRTANELAIHKSVVWKYRKLETEPSLTVLRLFSGVTGIPLTLAGEEPVRFHDGPRWLEEWESDVLVTLRRIEPRARRRVIDALREIVEAMGPAPRYSVSRKRSAVDQRQDDLPTADAVVKTLGADLADGAAAPMPSGAVDEPTAPPAADATTSFQRAPPRRGAHRSGKRRDIAPDDDPI